jgi:hypothetical protein
MNQPCCDKIAATAEKAKHTLSLESQLQTTPAAAQPLSLLLPTALLSCQTLMT